MQFHPSEEQVAIMDALRGTLVDTFPSDKMHAFFDGEEEIHQESWNALMELGVGGLMLPEDFGGTALGLVDAAMAIEVIGERAATGPIIGHLVTGAAIANSNNDDLKAKYLEKLVSGEIIATLALSGWQPNDFKLEENNGKVSGACEFVIGAKSAGLFLIGLKGGKLGLVNAGDNIEIIASPSTDRTRRHSIVTFNNADVEILDTNVDKALDAGLVLLAADALGGAQRCTDISVAYAKEREQFGVVIAQFQVIKHQLAQMALEVEPARALVWYAAYAYDSGQEDASRSAAIAKSHLCDRFTNITRAAVQAHGGIGYTWEYDLAIWVRRQFLNRAYLGAPSLHRQRAAELAGW